MRRREEEPETATHSLLMISTPESSTWSIQLCVGYSTPLPLPPLSLSLSICLSLSIKCAKTSRSHTIVSASPSPHSTGRALLWAGTVCIKRNGCHFLVQSQRLYQFQKSDVVQNVDTCKDVKENPSQKQPLIHVVHWFHAALNGGHNYFVIKTDVNLSSKLKQFSLNTKTPQKRMKVHTRGDEGVLRWGVGEGRKKERERERGGGGADRQRQRETETETQREYKNTTTTEHE